MIGDEILTGRVVDLNLQAIARRFSEIGIRVSSATAVPDSVQAISRAVRDALETNGQVVCCGGLGPTSDDLTRQGLARAMRVRVVFSEKVMVQVRQRLAEMGHQELPIHRNYGKTLREFKIIPNPVGLAPGLLWRDRERFVLALPGVPEEADAILQEAIPAMADISGENLAVGTVAVAGLREAEIAARLARFRRLSARVGFYPRLVEVILKVRAENSAKLAELVGIVKQELGEAVYSEEDEGLESALGRLLRQANLSLATAESCTGGLVSHLITQVPGSSDYYRGGAVAYSAEAKSRILGVPEDLMARFSVYSTQVAEAMAAGAARVFSSDMAISTTCVAGPGPDGEHPAGKTAIGIFLRGKTRSLELDFRGQRAQVKMAVAKTALDLARREVTTPPEKP